MAEADSMTEDQLCCKLFELHVSKSEGAKQGIDCTKASSKALAKMLKDTYGDKSRPLIQKIDTGLFQKHQDKAKKVAEKDFMEKMLPELAKTACPKKSEGEACQEMKKKFADQCKKELSGEKKGADAAVVSRLTDTSKYTGAHKERFGADGKGKGIDGREDRHDNDGYVGNYKNKDTYGTKK